MRSPAMLLAALASLSPLALAQEVTVPEGFETSYTGNTGLLWRSTAFRYQCVYDPVHFVNQSLGYPIEVTRLRFRPLNGIVDPGGQVYTGVTIELSTSQTDSQTISTTFTANTGADAVVVYTGDVTLLPTTGGTPNDHHIDITLQTPFVYDPNAGPLLVDVTAPTAPSAPVPNMAASNDRFTQFAARNSSSNPAALTGGISSFAAAMKIDYNILPGTALATNYGAGCLDRPRMFYEDFPTGTSPIDLVGTAQSMFYQASAEGGNYLVIQGGPAYATPGAGAVDLLTLAPTSSSSSSWDDGSIIMTLPAAFGAGFPFPGPGGGGSTLDITINSNGKIYLGNTVDGSFATNGAPYGSLAPFEGTSGAGLPVLAAFNCDLDPTVGGNLWYEDTGLASGGVRITWDNILNWQDPAGSPALPNSFQIELIPGGQVNFAYGSALGLGGNGSNALVGFSAGGGEPVGPMVDWSTFNAYQSGDGTVPLIMDAGSRPLIGTTVNLVTGNVPSTALGTLSVLGFNAIVPGASLAGLGMPGCTQHIGLIGTDTLFLLGSPTATRPLIIPNDMSYVGINVFAQSLSLVPNVNAFGGITSNGVRLAIGSL